MTFDLRQREIIIYWLPAIAGGLFAWVVFVTLGQTPLIRASGLALVIVGVILTLRELGPALAVAGGLALAFCPAFWSQTGGGESAGPATVVLATAAAGFTAVLFVGLIKRPYLALVLGFLIFALIFWSQIGTPRSLRLTGLLTAWLLYILIDAMRASNPRPDGPPPTQISIQQSLAMLIILFIGVINDPLFVLLLPAVAIGMWLSNTPLRWWYWGAMLVVLVIGLVSIRITYVDPMWWEYPALQAHNSGVSARYIIAGGWREGIRWVELIGLVITQFTVVGAVLSVLGLARMARWYPVLGIVLMFAYAFYSLFGLVYFGWDREILLVPLFIIQINWLTYAVHTFGQWLAKSPRSSTRNLQWLITMLYFALPVYLLLGIVQGR